MRFRLIVAFCILSIVSTFCPAQTVSGTTVMNGWSNSTPLHTGQVCFNITCFTVTNGAFTGTVGAGTYNVTVLDERSNLVLTLYAVVIPASGWTYDGYTIPLGSPPSPTAAGVNPPYLPCAEGAYFTQTNPPLPSNATWICGTVGQQNQWYNATSSFSPQLINPNQPISIIGSGAPTAACSPNQNNRTNYTAYINGGVVYYQCSSITGTYKWNVVSSPGCSTSLPCPTIQGGTLSADQWQTPATTGNNGILNSISQCASLPYACSIVAPNLYAKVEAQPWGGPLSLFSLPTGGPLSTQSPFDLVDQRFGVMQEYINYGPGNTLNPRLIASATTTAPTTQYSGLSPALQLQSSTYAGTRNQGPGGDKTTDHNLQQLHYKWGAGQTYFHSEALNGYGVGDNVGTYLDIATYGGPGTQSDEGSEAHRDNVFQQGYIFTGIAGTISTASDGSVTIPTTSQTNPGTQGVGRMVIDITKSVGSLGGTGGGGYINVIGQAANKTNVQCTGGCAWTNINGNDSTSTTLTAASPSCLSGGSNICPRSPVTLQVASSLLFPASGLVCIFDVDYECEEMTSKPDTTHIILATMRIPHQNGATVVYGGLTGYAMDFPADRVCPTGQSCGTATPGTPIGTNGRPQPIDAGLNSVVRYAIPIISSSGNQLYLFAGYDALPGTGHNIQTAAYPVMGSGGTATVTASSGLVTGCTVSGGSGYSFNGQPQIVLTGTWTTPPTVWVTSIGGSLSTCGFTPGSGVVGTPTATVTPTNDYAIYPAAKIWSVYNPVAVSPNPVVDGTLFAEPPAGTFASGDTLEVPDGNLMETAIDNDGMGQYTPDLNINPHGAINIQMRGLNQNVDFASNIVNATDPSVYSNNALSTLWVPGRGLAVPPQGHTLNGSFSTGWVMDTPPYGPGKYNFLGAGAVQVQCGQSHGFTCASWSTGYNILQAYSNLSPAFATNDVLHYNPLTYAWYLTSAWNGTVNNCRWTFDPTAGFSQSGTVCPNGSGFVPTFGKSGDSAPLGPTSFGDLQGMWSPMQASGSAPGVNTFDSGIAWYKNNTAVGFTDGEAIGEDSGGSVWLYNLEQAGHQGWKFDAYVAPADIITPSQVSFEHTLKTPTQNDNILTEPIAFTNVATQLALTPPSPTYSANACQPGITSLLSSGGFSQGFNQCKDAAGNSGLYFWESAASNVFGWRFSTYVGGSAWSSVTSLTLGHTLPQPTVNDNIQTSLSGTTGTITGTALTATCNSGTVAVTGAVVGQPVAVSSTTGADVGGAFNLRASVTSAGTVTVYICGTGTPASLAYNVRVLE